VIVYADTPGKKQIGAGASWRWVPAGEPIQVGRLSIPGGMIYVGKGMRSVGGAGTEPALICPNLSVATERPNLTGDGVHYWPSYDDLTPEARAAYLLWLANGRRSPGAYIGYVFLFFYGLERRVLGDGVHREIPQIRTEVESLLTVYGDSGSFASYGHRFLDVCSILSGLKSPCEVQEAGAAVRGEVPFPLKVELGRLSRDARPIPTAVALWWLKCAPDIRSRTAMERCRDEFCKLFAIRYREHFGEGMVVEPNKTKLSLRYRPASRTFAGEIPIPIEDLPDLTALQRPIKELDKLADACVEALDPYSRWLGRNPNGRGTPEAVALLPSPLAMDCLGTDLRVFGDWLGTLIVDNHPVLMDRSKFVEHWPGKSTGDSAGRRTWIELSRVLQLLGYGIEPDVRFQGPALDRTDHVALFKVGDESMEAPGADYLLAMLMARFGILIAGADGNVSPDEMLKLVEMLKEKLALSPSERVRLAAHLKWLTAEGASFAGMKKKLDGLGLKHRESIAHVATMVALADGRITKEESSSLAKVYGLLGLDPARVYQDVHALGVDGAQARDSDLVRVRQASTGGKGYSIPEPPATPNAERVVLDLARLQKKEAETRDVAAILKNVFAEDEPPAPKPSPPTAGALAGLDLQHSLLVRRLLDRAIVSRSEWESWCVESGLLPDGAVDRINEAALDACGDPILGGEDPIEVDKVILKEMVA
jgi:tellurite resistance protein